MRKSEKENDYVEAIVFFGVLVGIGVLLAVSGVSTEAMEIYKWPFVIAGTILFFVMIALLKGDEKVCAWCGSSKIKFSSGVKAKGFGNTETKTAVVMSE